MIRIGWLMLGLCLALAVGPVRADGTLVIAGGHVAADNDDLWRAVIAHAGGNQARIAVMPTANKAPDSAGARMVEIFRRHGGDGFVVPLTPQDGRSRESAVAQSPDWAAQVAAATGVWFLGGNQDRIVAALRDEAGRPTAVLDAVWQVYRRGGLVGGASAGAAIMSTTMFTHALPVGRLLRQGLAPGRNTLPGLGFIGPDWFVDQHFLVRKRLPRTLIAAPLMGYARAIGIDEDTAAVITPDRRLTVVGRSAVVALRFPGLVAADDGRVCHAERGIALDYLRPGDGLDMTTATPLSGDAVPAGSVPAAADGANFTKDGLIAAQSAAAAGPPVTIRQNHIDFTFRPDDGTRRTAAGSITGLRVDIACGPKAR